MSGATLLVGAAASLCLGLVMIDASGVSLGPVRVLAAAVLTMYVPGAALLRAIWPGWQDRWASLALSLPFSLGIVGLSTLAAEKMGLGLRPPALLASTFGTSMALLLVAAIRETRSELQPPAMEISPRAAGGTVRGGEALASRSRSPRTLVGWAPLDGAPAPISLPRVAITVPRLAITVPRLAITVPTASRLVHEALTHAREPLFLHAYALALSGIVTSGLGVVYWAIAARVFPAEVVGVNAALLSLVTLLGNISQLNLRSGFSRFVPLAGTQVRRFLGTGYLAAVTIATIGSLTTVQLLNAAPWLAPDIEMTPLLAILFPLTAIASTVFGLQDQALTALRRTVWVPVENAAFAVLKIGLLVIVAGAVGTYGILASWTVPMIVLVAVVTPWIFRSAAPAYVRAMSLLPRGRGMPASRRADQVGRTGQADRWDQAERRRPRAARRKRSRTIEPLTDDRLSVRSVLSYVGVEYVASLFAIGSTALLPIIVLSLLGAASSAHFYIVVLVASAAELLPAVVTTSLLVEASASTASFEQDGRRVLRQLAVTVLPLIAIIVVGAPWILGIFGADYAAEGTTALRLMALSGIPYALTQLSFSRLRLERRVGRVLASQAALAIANLGGCLVLLPILGLEAAGLVALVADLVVAIVLVRTELWGVVVGPAWRGSDRPGPDAT